MYSFTVAIAKELLALGRFGDVLRMIEPLLQDSGEATTPAISNAMQLPLRCIGAQIAIREQNRPEHAIRLLAPYANAPVCDPKNFSEASAALWLGWALARAPSENPMRAVYLLRKASTFFKTKHRENERFWALLGLVEAFERVNQPANSAAALVAAGACLRYSQDASARREYEKVFFDVAGERAYSSHSDHTRLPGDCDPVLTPATDEAAKRAALSTAPLLLTGETGSGKATLAAYIHRQSNRRDQPMTCIDCADMEVQYTWSEPARFKSSLSDTSNGAVFLKHIDALPSTLQLILLEQLTAKEEPAAPGGGLRLIASTSIDVEEKTRAGAFDARLFYVLQTNMLPVPALRDYPELIEPLAHRFKKRFAPADAPLVAITEPAMDRLCGYRWPGNIRQLRNEIERILAAVALDPLPIIHTHALDSAISNARHKTKLEPEFSGDEVPLEDILADTERQVVEQVLLDHDGHITASADSLGLTRQGLYKKIKRLGIIVSQINK